MLTEAISFEMAYRFFETLDKIKISTSLIKMAKFNGTKTTITAYNSLSAMYTDLVNYRFIDVCAHGDIWYISSFQSQSVLYGFTTLYTGTDIIGAYTLYYGKDSDQNRNLTYQTSLKTQKATIDSLIRQYRTNYLGVNKSYVYGIYSPCYAEAGWSEGTGYLADMRIKVKDYRNLYTI